MTYYKEPENPKVGDLWIKDGETYRWDGKRWVKLTTIDEIYDYADLIVGTLNRKNIAMFDQLKTLPKKEKVIIINVTKVFNEIDKYTRSYLLILAKKVYKQTCGIFGFDEISTLDMAWIGGILKDYDAVTKYVYIHEVDRKRARLIEAMMASDNPAEEVESALKSWAKQVSQYADNITHKAMLKAYEDWGVSEVLWQTEEDARVCSICDRLNGKVFLEEDVPDKPHYGCRCTIIPLAGLEED